MVSSKLRLVIIDDDDFVKVYLRVYFFIYILSDFFAS